jgi:hypothetical protein
MTTILNLIGFLLLIGGYYLYFNLEAFNFQGLVVGGVSILFFASAILLSKFEV